MTESKLPENFTVPCRFAVSGSLMMAEMSVSKIVVILSHINATVECGFSIILNIWSNGLLAR